MSTTVKKLEREANEEVTVYELSTTQDPVKTPCTMEAIDQQIELFQRKSELQLEKKAEWEEIKAQALALPKDNE